MKFVTTIIENSKVKEAKLYGPSQKASERPETGITINTPAAFHVIKDCATLAFKYLPHYVFGTYANPFEVLKGKVTRADIEEFVSAAAADIVMNQLMVLIVNKIKTTTVVNNFTAVNTTSNALDPYNDYNDDVVVASQSAQNDVLTLLCTAFSV